MQEDAIDVCQVHDKQYVLGRTDCMILSGIHTAGKTQFGGFQLQGISSVRSLPVAQHYYERVCCPKACHLGFLSFGYQFLYESSYAGTSLCRPKTTAPAARSCQSGLHAHPKLALFGLLQRPTNRNNT